MTKIEVHVGDILSVDYGIIVQQVNAQSVMGSGVAKSIRDVYPGVYDHYVDALKSDTSSNLTSRHLGKLLVYKVPGKKSLYIANIVGQDDYRRYAAETTRYTSYDALDNGFQKLAWWNAKLLPVHFPKIGSDRGGGNWDVVKHIIMHRLPRTDLNLWVLPDRNTVK